MKKLLPFLCAMLWDLPASAQELVLPKDNEITVKEGTVDTAYFIPLRWANRPRNADLVLTITNAAGGNAAEGVDYAYLANQTGNKNFPRASADDDFAIGIVVRSRKIKREKVFFEIIFTYAVGNDIQTKRLKINIEPLNNADKKPALPDTAKWTLRLITGSNFDFFDGPTFKNFAGSLDAFLPDLVQYKSGKKTRSVGIHIGVFNFRYFDADSSRGNMYTDKYLLDPTVRKLSVDTTRYVEDVYALNSRTNYNTFGAYFNPLLRLPVESKWLDLYLSLHFEKLWRTQILEYTKVSLRKDTFTLRTADIAQNVVLQSYPGLRPTYTKRTFEDTYLGISLPMKINIKNRFDLYLAPTFGYTSFEGTNIQESVLNGIRYRRFSPEVQNKSFLLTKVQLVTTIAPVDLALGGEFRQVFGQRTFYALYFGALIGVDKLKR